MSPFPATFYADCRRRVSPGQILREDGPQEVPSERLLQAVWQHQRLQRERLLTIDERPVTVLHPGFWNREAGPDFRGAVLQFGSDSPVTGDIEVDLQAGGWRAHGHDRNQSFQNVVLHVVWQASGATYLPTLELKGRLDAPLHELGEWLGRESSQRLPPDLAGQCCAPLRELPEETLRQLLEQAALCRLRAKAAQLAARARQCGWEQALLEGLFRALGYKHNTWPMQRLGELIPALRTAGTEPESALVWQARLLGLAGLLPADCAGKEPAPGGQARAPGNRQSAAIRRLWDVWWRERDAFHDCILPRAVWRLGGLRPANHPQRRLALAAHWLADADWLSRLEKWFLTPLPPSAGVAELTRVLQPGSDAFWTRHWTLTSPRLERPQPLLGSTRATDLAVNVLLPWFHARAGVGRNVSLQQAAEARLLAWPPAQDNAVLKLARQRLLGARPALKPRTAALQQGLIQIVRDFCDHSNAICEQCPFPELVRPLAARNAALPENMA